MEKLVVMGGVGEDDTKGKVSLITTIILAHVGLKISSNYEWMMA